MIILLFAGDVGQMMGIAIRRETAIQSQLMCLDELALEVGDWVDIGGPLGNTKTFPVTVKSLVFYQLKEYLK